MKIQPITNCNYSNRQFSVNKANRHVSFSANPEKYSYEIRKLAKKYKDNPNWKECMRERKVSVGKAALNWQNFAECGVAGRVLLDVLTLGGAEITYSASAATAAAVNNSCVESNIKQVEACMKDMDK